MRWRSMRWIIVWGVAPIALWADPIFIDDPRSNSGGAVDGNVLPSAKTNQTDQFIGDLPELSLESLLSPSRTEGVGAVASDVGSMSRLLVNANWKPEVERMIGERNWIAAFRLARRELEERPSDTRRLKIVAVLAGLAGHGEQASTFFQSYLKAVPRDRDAVCPCDGLIGAE